MLINQMKLAVVLVSSCFGVLAFANEASNLNKEGYAAKGFDVVSYFDDQKPSKGDKNFLVEHAGVKYLFKNIENKKKFETSPERYLPQYGGWCAYAVSYGKKVDVDPKSYLVSEGKLYLFYKDFFTDTRKSWLKDEKKLLALANEKWPQVKSLKEE